MAKHQPSNGSIARYFWTFVAENPQLAAGIAFELGALAAQMVHSKTSEQLQKSGRKAARSLSKSAHNAQETLVNALPDMPDLAKLTGLKFLPGPSLKLPPRKRRVSKRVKVARRAS